jgi:hypothetical protein
MTIKHNDISVSARAVHLQSLIAEDGITGPRSAIELNIHNNSSTSIVWINVEIAINATETIRIRASDGSNVTRISGYALDKTTIRNISAGEKRIIYLEKAKTPPFHLYRIYGQYANGSQFVSSPPFWLSIGVKSKTTDCFIATAAYQDTEHPMVCELRLVRDELLVKTASGRRFIKWYYRNGPRLAAIVAPRPSLRAASRAILTPVALLVRAARCVAGSRNRNPRSDI